MDLGTPSVAVVAKLRVAAPLGTIVWIRLGEPAVRKLQLVRVFVLVERCSAAPQAIPVAITTLEATTAAGRVRRALQAEPAVSIRRCGQRADSCGGAFLEIMLLLELDARGKAGHQEKDLHRSLHADTTRTPGMLLAGVMYAEVR